MNNLKIPNCTELMSIYGFDCSLDDLIQTAKFLSGDFSLTISFDLSIDSLRVLLEYNNAIVCDFYSENLSSVITDSEGKLISFIVKDRKLDVSLYPQIFLSFFDM